MEQSLITDLSYTQKEEGKTKKGKMDMLGRLLLS